MKISQVANKGKPLFFSWFFIYPKLVIKLGHLPCLNELQGEPIPGSMPILRKPNKRTLWTLWENLCNKHIRCNPYIKNHWSNHIGCDPRSNYIKLGGNFLNKDDGDPLVSIYLFVQEYIEFVWVSKNLYPSFLKFN